MKLEPGQEIGQYRVIEQVGRGGMAVVYRAHQASLARYVAIKVLPAYLREDPSFEKRFQSEAIAVASLRHPNIPVVFDYGDTGTTSYLVTEFLDGGTLAEQLGQPLPLDYVVQTLGPIASAIDYAHARGVLHRDIKPANILLARDGRPLLNDFGLARMMENHEERLTIAGQVMGTPEYMAPEQCEGLETGRPADLYSLAVVAYHMLTGRVPFSAGTPAAVLIAQVHDPLPPPRLVNPTIPPHVEEALLRGLAKNPEHRYQTAADLLAALGRGGATTVTAAATGKAGLRHPLRGRPAVVLAAVGVLALVAAGAVAGAGLLRGRGAAAPAASASPSPIALARGELLWSAALDGSPAAFSSPLPGSDTAATLWSDGGGKLSMAIVKPGGRLSVNCGMAAHPQFVGEVVFAMQRGSDMHFTWLVRRGDRAAHQGTISLDFASKQGTVQMTLDQPAGGIQLQGPAIQVPGLAEGRQVTVDAVSLATETRVYLDGKQVLAFAESGVAPSGGMGLAIRGSGGTVNISAVRAYALPA